MLVYCLILAIAGTFFLDFKCYDTAAVFFLYSLIAVILYAKNEIIEALKKK